MKWAREQDPPDEEPSKPACTLHSCPEAESSESPREREKKIQGQVKRERQRKLKMRRGIRDDASCFKGLGHDFAPTAVAVMNQPLD